MRARALEISASRAAYSVSVTAASCLSRKRRRRARGGWVRRVAERRADDRRVGGAAPARLRQSRRCTRAAEPATASTVRVP